MNIIFTGASSFTGYWFVRELLAAGHRVTATFQQPLAAYAGSDPRAARVAALQALAKGSPALRLAPECRFGDNRFLALIGEHGCDLLCHHAADVTNYRSPDFDVATALKNNTNNLAAVLKTLQTGGCTRVLLTGSVFEGDEGAGSVDAAGRGLIPFSAYGLSKQLTAAMFDHYCGRAGFGLGKFVIPNPFGPLEEKRFGSYLMDCWFGGKTASVKTPDYVRDNIHVSLLAKAYANFAKRLADGKPGTIKLNPSGYVESQWRFTQRLAEEMRPRLGLPCLVEKLPQADWSEPRMRINTDHCDAASLSWDESSAWDAYAEYYRRLNGR